MNGRRVVAVIAAALLALTAARTAAAQEPQTRAEALRLQREEKARRTAPYQPSRLERALLWLENRRVLERVLNPPEGWYPKIGNVTTGSGFAVGPAYRKPGLFGGRASFSTFALGSLSKYWLIDARLTAPELAGGRAFAELLAQRSDFPSEDFYGLGPDSRREDATTFGLRNQTIEVKAGIRPTPWLSLGGGVTHLNPHIGSGAEGPSVEEVFTPSQLPGLLEQPDFVRYEATAQVSNRSPRNNPRRGGQYTLSLQTFDDRSGNVNDFTRVELELQHYLPLLKDRRVMALRALVSSSDADAGRQVPFYLQRTLGGPDTLRGFRRFRFRDENLLLLQAEYRWEIFTAVDGAIFFDAGNVAPTFDELSLRHLESDYGIGFRFGTINGVFLRIEGAFGSSGGKHFVWVFDHVF
jgi:outer membrane protein assembly factor BamA